MRAIFCLDDTHTPLLHELLDEFSVDYCQIVYDLVKPAPAPASGAVLHFWGDLAYDAEYHVDWSTLRPLDEELVERMQATEAIFLKMADRLESVRPYPYVARKELYLKHLRYWNHVLTENKIDVFVSANIPHVTFDYVVYSLCKLYGIATVFFCHCQIDDTVLPIDDWEQSTAEIGRRVAELTEQYERVPEEQIELHGRFARDFHKHVLAGRNPVLAYMQPKTTKGPTLRARAHNVARIIGADPSFLVTHVFNPDYWANRYYRGPGARRRDEALQRRYEALTEPPDLGRRFIYFPLHFQPEMTTSPMAGAYVEQILMAQMLAALLPPDVHLYVKEHPLQKRLGRSPELYDELRRLPRTHLVPRAFDTYELTNRCVAVATATGTAGWEALYRGKPVLLFGHHFYQYAPAVFTVRTIEDCRRALQQILVDGARPALKQMKVFLKALEDTTIEGYVDPNFQPASMLSPEQNRANIGAAIRERLRRVQPSARLRSTS